MDTVKTLVKVKLNIKRKLETISIINYILFNLSILINSVCFCRIPALTVREAKQFYFGGISKKSFLSRNLSAIKITSIETTVIWKVRTYLLSTCLDFHRFKIV